MSRNVRPVLPRAISRAAARLHRGDPRYLRRARGRGGRGYCQVMQRWKLSKLSASTPILLCRYLLGYQEGGGGLMGCVEGFTNMGTDEQLALPITTSSTYQSLAPTTTISTESTGARSPVVVRPAQPSDAGTLAANKKRDTSGSKVCPTNSS